MKSFGSFSVNHLHLEPGVYVSRIDRVDTGVVYTVDIRMCKPYVDKLLTNVEMHSIEHIVATNMEAECKEGYIKKVYFGPMGCQTGFYALFFVPDSILNTRSSSEIELMIIRIMKNCTKNHVDSVPFNSRVECGNCRTLAKNRRQIEKVNSKLQFMYSLFQNCYLGCSFDDYPE